MDFLKQDQNQEMDRISEDQLASISATRNYMNFNSTSSGELQLMDISSKMITSDHEEDISNWYSTQKEHMFDKVVTPSDVGKLNRLVIPKQYAEKYFPLDSSKNEKDLILNFQDTNGKIWRFRYSYWNSSQSYVITKGWSRFVKEKTLHAGDTVSFQRRVGGSGKDHVMYIDWRRRALQFDTNHPQQYYFGQPDHDHNRFYTVLPISVPILSHQNFQYLDFNPPQKVQTHNWPVVFESEAVLNVGDIGKSSTSTNSPNCSSKRLRLFGVNMEYCPKEEEEEEEEEEEREPNVKITMPASTSIQRLKIDSRISSNTVAEFSRKGKSILPNCNFDLD